MVVFFPISGLAILVLILGVCGIAGNAFLAVVNWLMDFWWLIGIFFAISAIVQLFICDSKWKYLFLILDIPRLAALTFLVYQFAANCIELAAEGGLAIFFFILEFFISGVCMLAILIWGTAKCFEALEEISYDTAGGIVKYIAGTFICIIGTLLFWVISN
ncbi:MAG: hypothetical protein IJC88_01120 [Oscillospiraceae bacterium]|nr:hypothetical protein [Oscillospiraceae bacterium]